MNNSSRVFVGNIPYECTQQEFYNCFKNMNGFVGADLMLNIRSNLSRGYGFVVYDTPENANILVNSSVSIKERELRFSPYSAHTQRRLQIDKTLDNHQVPKIFVPNMELTIDPHELTKEFAEYGEVVSCNMTIKNNKTYAVILYKDIEAYDACLTNKKDREVVPYETNIHKYHDPAVIYREGFRAGQLVGYQQGLEDAQNKQQN